MLMIFCVIQPQGSPLYISTKLAWEKLECLALKKVLSFDSDAGHTLIVVWTYPVVTPPVKHMMKSAYTEQILAEMCHLVSVRLAREQLHPFRSLNSWACHEDGGDTIRAAFFGKASRSET